MATVLTLDQPGWYDRVTSASVKLGDSYQEDGFRIRDALGDPFGLLYRLSDPSTPFPKGTGPYLSAGVAFMEQTSGLRFGVTSVDVDTTAASVLFTGVRADGSSVTFNAAADATSGFQTISLPQAFTQGLTALSFASPGLVNLSFDNVVVANPSVFRGGAANDQLTGTARDDDILGGEGNDTLVGADGSDWLDGGAGNDSMAGGAGDDIYFVDSARDVVREQNKDGIDTVRTGLSYDLGAHLERLELTGTANANGSGNQLDNVILGNAGANVLRGGPGEDLVKGGAGDDSLFGDQGADTLAGGDGFDRLTGGPGADRFLFERGELNTLPNLGEITDFSGKHGDTIDVGGLFVYRFMGSAPFTGTDDYNDGSGQYRYQAVAGGVEVSGDVDGDGMADWAFGVAGASSLSASDFV